jgi:two-component system, chemotaxis family, response regulator Rcp1
MNPDKKVNILLVEDSPGDVELTCEALSLGKIDFNLRVVYDGEEALIFLNKQGKYCNAQTPDLILLDLNMPRKDGLEVLKEIRASEQLKSIPVIILTTSNSELDIFKCYDNHANAYFVKPVDLNEFFDVIRTIEEFWFNVATLPFTAN